MNPVTKTIILYTTLICSIVLTGAFVLCALSNQSRAHHLSYEGVYR